jgi:CBS-domain-containing membrane protein
MLSTVAKPVAPRLTLEAVTAANLMTDNPVSLDSAATVSEAKALLSDRGISAAPVIDNCGHPVGVVSKADVLIHDRELTRMWSGPESRPGVIDPTRVDEIMTPAVFSVTADTPSARVVEEMVTLNVHQLFVVDRHGTLVGSITALDVLRRLHAE